MKKRLLIGSGLLIVIVAVVAVIASFSFAEPLENHVKVEEDSELTYYIDVSYDGRDSTATTSSDSATAEVYSDYIYVEDKLPEGLTFVDFVQTEDGTIGATKRSDGTFCAGYVEDGVNGLSYDPDTRTVSFRVKNLKAGCKLTVGIITRTPKLASGQTRMDFYNTAFARENNFYATSNTVHVYIGRDTVDMYSVSYQYTGTVPDGAPALPEAMSYAPGTTVGVAQDVSLPGYVFSGWETETVPITAGNTFTMPSQNVVFTGSFTEDNTPKYEVSYEVSGAPDGYMPPKSASYQEGSDVTLDSLKPGDIINGYRFLGWKSTDISLPSSTDEDEATIFTMPDQNVVITGEFERVSYTVTYQFQGSVLPPNAESLLPDAQTYYPGDTVTLESVKSEPDGYQFLGWYQADEFTMPENDVVVYGEWAVRTGTFAPTISKKITNPQASYQSGDTVNFEITVTNTADFEIKDVLLEEQLNGVKFVSGSNYTVMSDTFVKISSIPASGSVTVNAQYDVGDDVIKTFTNVVVLTGALADNNYSLDTSQEYKAEIQFVVSNIELQITKVNEEGETLEGADFTLYSNSSLTQEVSSGLTFKGLAPNTTYYLEETRVPTGYQSLGKVLEINVDSDGNITIPGYDVTNQNGVAKVSIVNQEINILPNTGGVGIIPFIIGGLILIVVGVVCSIRMIRKRGDKFEKDNN